MVLDIQQLCMFCGTSKLMAILPVGHNTSSTWISVGTIMGPTISLTILYYGRGVRNLSYSTRLWILWNYLILGHLKGTPFFKWYFTLIFMAASLRMDNLWLLQCQCINSSPPSAASLSQWIWSALVQTMAYHLFGARPLIKPILGYCQLDPKEILIKIQNVSFTKMHLKISSAKWRPFCPGRDKLILKITA